MQMWINVIMFILNQQFQAKFYVTLGSRLLGVCWRTVIRIRYTRWFRTGWRGLASYRVLFKGAELSFKFRQPCQQNYIKSTFVTCTIITKGGRGVTKHLSHGAVESRRWRERTGSHAKLENFPHTTRRIKCVKTPKICRNGW